MPRVLTTVLGGRCPACGEVSAFAGFFRLQTTCAACGVRFERWSGSWTIPTVAGYTTGFLAAMGLAVFLHRSRGLHTGDEFAVAGMAVLGAIVPYRFIKGAYLWTLWNAGLIFRDDDPRAPTTAR